MTKHGWFLAAGGSVLAGWYLRDRPFFLTLGIATAGYCVYRGGKAVSDPIGRKNGALTDAVQSSDAGPPDGGQSSAQNLPQRSSGTSGKATWGSGKKNKMFRDPAYAPSNSMFTQTRSSGPGTSGLTYPGGVKFTPNYGAVTADPIAASTSPTGSPTATAAVVPPRFLGRAKGDMTYFSAADVADIGNPFRN